MDKPCHSFYLKWRFLWRTGSFSNGIFCGKQIGEDLGIGPVRYLTAEQVMQVANAVALVKLQHNMILMPWVRLVFIRIWG
ncbi:DUF1877 family protein [Acinetobacter sp.]|uniref:DUF1877 family protein n=1 Tax=Acinetobacter sp. TaxID=472 RepID=UPI00338D83CA